MPIDYKIYQGPRGGMTFDFVPSHASAYDSAQYFHDRKGADTFSITENAYLFIEKAVMQGFKEYGPYSHWGVSCISASTWSGIFKNLNTLRFDIRTGMHPKRLIEIHVPYRAFFRKAGRLNRKALLNFLDEFEQKSRELLTSYPYIIIGGI